MSNISTGNIVGSGGYGWGDDFKKAFSASFGDMFSGANMGKAAVGGIGALGSIASGFLSNGFSTTGGQVLGAAGDVAMAFNPIIGGALKLTEGITNRAFGTKWNDKAVAEAKGNIKGLNNFVSNASNYDALSSDFNSIEKMNKTYKASDLGEDGWLVNRTEHMADELNRKSRNAFSNAMRGAAHTADNIASTTLANLERNYSAFGGPLFAYGGQTHGSDFTNGLMFINNGGTHESNPYEGIPISMDKEGNPNLVEEGEVIWNDYVFSNRLKVPKSIQKKYKLGKKKMTFANAVDKLSKESEERPNDPISMRGLESILMNMAIEQETLKSKQQPKNIEKNKFNIGGDTNPYKPYSWISDYNGGWFDNNGEYTQEYRDYVKAITKEQMLQAFNDNYNYYLNAANKETDRYNAIAKFYNANPNYNASLTELSDDMFKRSKKLMLDGKPGFMHNVAASMRNTPVEPSPQTVTANRYYIRNADGTVTQMIDNLPFEGLNENGRTWEYLNPNLIFGAKQVRDPKNVNGVSTIYTDYYYDRKEEPTKENTTSPATTPKNLPTWLRYAPVLGHSLGLAHNLFQKPNYENADAIIKASKNLYSNPIKFNPIGDYMAYTPFDTEYHANQLRSVAGATRRNIMNTSGGNRATAMAGILAADNNAMNQMGDLYRKAAEYNLEQRQKALAFNRATNQFNSEGAFRADQANQAARQASLEGIIKGYTMKESINALKNQAISDNLSGLFQSLGDIGYDNLVQNQINWRTSKGVDGPGTEFYMRQANGYGNKKGKGKSKGQAKVKG